MTLADNTFIVIILGFLFAPIGIILALLITKGYHIEGRLWRPKSFDQRPDNEASTLPKGEKE